MLEPHSRFMTNWRRQNLQKDAGENYQAEIGFIHIAGRIASAAIVEDSLLGVDYVNHFHLLKIEGQWRIVSKIYTDVG